MTPAPAKPIVLALFFLVLLASARVRFYELLKQGSSEKGGVPLQDTLQTCSCYTPTFSSPPRAACNIWSKITRSLVSYAAPHEQRKREGDMARFLIRGLL